jgi:hypothetical protein
MSRLSDRERASRLEDREARERRLLMSVGDDVAGAFESVLVVEE